MNIYELVLFELEFLHHPEGQINLVFKYMIIKFES